MPARSSRPQIHADGEIYAAAMWRVKELYEARGRTRDDLLFDFVNGMFYTRANPTFEQMRDGMLAHLKATAKVNASAAADVAKRRCDVWKGFAALGIGDGARGTQTGKSVSIVDSFSCP